MSTNSIRKEIAVPDGPMCLTFEWDDDHSAFTVGSIVDESIAGSVTVGDILVAINGESMNGKSVGEVSAAVKAAGELAKTKSVTRLLTFVSPESSEAPRFVPTSVVSATDLATNDSMPLREGDIIYLSALYGEDSRACLSASSGTRVVSFQVDDDDGIDHTPATFRDCLWRVVLQLQYKASTEYTELRQRPSLDNKEWNYSHHALPRKKIKTLKA